MNRATAGGRRARRETVPKGDIRVYVGAFILALTASALLFYTGPLTKELDVRFYWAAFGCSVAAVAVSVLSLFLERK